MNKKNRNTITVDRTCLNLKISKYALHNNQSVSEVAILTEIIEKVATEEKKLNKPIMDISIDISQAKVLFPEEDVEQKSFLCFI